MFQLVGTTNGVPSDEDLKRTMRRGIPGTGMPAYGWMPDDDLDALARHVRKLAINGMVEVMADEARERGVPFDAHQAKRSASKRMTPGRTVGIPMLDPRDESQVETIGKPLFIEHCAACHGTTGRGRPPQQQWMLDSFNYTRDLAVIGALKGGSQHADLVRRIRAGMPASGMPPTEMDDARFLAILATYVRNFVMGMGGGPDADQVFLQTRRPVRVARVADPLPTTRGDPRWQETEETTVVLAPLVGTEDSVRHAMLSAIHDGERLAVRVRWPDSTRDDRAVGAALYPDAAALQFSSAQQPPLFGMGSADEPVNIWHWRAFRPEAVAGLFDLMDRNHPGARAGTDGYFPLDGLLEATTAASSVPATGHESAEEFDAYLDEYVVAIGVEPHWENGWWDVIFVRDLVSGEDYDVNLLPGTTAQIACAVWNGAGDEHGLRKSISIWQELILDA